MAVPIWQDNIIHVNSAQSATFIIYCGSVQIYSGKVYSKDSTNGGVDIRINDICADYLRSTLPTRSALSYSSTGVVQVTFYADVKVGSATSRTIVEFSPDWSYDRNFSGVFSSQPIRKKFVAGQTLFLSYATCPATIAGTITKDSGSAYTISASRSVSTSWNGLFDATFLALHYVVVEAGTIAINLSQYPNAKTITIGSGDDTMVWEREDTDARYILHYVNAYGGWDSLPMVSGKITDNYTRKTASRLIDNSKASMRENMNFANIIKHKYELHTGWLLGTAGEKMYHLMGSTNVYLQDLDLGEIVPVNITDTSCEYKTYRNQGGKLVDYTINCELALNRRRL